LLDASAMKNLAIAFLLFAACSTGEPSVLVVEKNCLTCDSDDPDDPNNGGGGGGAEDPCDTACTANVSCDRACRKGSAIVTCGEVQQCIACDSYCDADAACGFSCLDEGTVSTCEAQGACQRYDVYCSAPVITSASVSDTHESIGNAYMYFESAAAPKVNDYPASIGGVSFNGDAWASNFRGPVPKVDTRTQWEWDDPGSDFHDYPYVYGWTCSAVPVGAPQPSLGSKVEFVREHDGALNGDDFVGLFQIDNKLCDELLRGEQESTWTDEERASTSGSIASMTYRLWCYSCRNAPSPDCYVGITL
jgi:hypothetical protein